MAFIGLSIPSDELLPLLNGHEGLIGLTFKTGDINAGNPIVFDINQVIFNPNVNTNPVTFIPAQPKGGIIYREDNISGSPYLSNSKDGVAIGNDEFQFMSAMPYNFAFFPKDAIFTLGSISSNLIFSGAACRPGLVAYSGAGITGEYGSLKVEVDRDAMNITSGNKIANKKIPAAILGTPCPPFWDPY